MILILACKDFSREPQSPDWQLFCKHLHRVRVFTDSKSVTCRLLRSIFLSTEYQFGRNVMKTLVPFICQHNSLFPKLQSLIVANVQAEHWFPRYLPHLSLNTLESIEIGPYIRLSSGKPKDDMYVEWSELIPLMRSAWPHLRSIKLNACLESCYWVMNINFVSESSPQLSGTSSFDGSLAKSSVS